MPPRSRKGSSLTLKTEPANSIIIRGARVHNLKNIDLDLPRNKLIVVTGVSGSGKSSLAFDTIYAEGQRRYVESLSSYARQFLDRMDKPDVDLIQGISPAVAIEQKTNTRNPRSTVGTSTEVYDYLRLLFARIGKTFCRNCGKEVKRDSVHSVTEALQVALASKNVDELRTYVGFPLPMHPRESVRDAIANIKKEGFYRLIVGEDVIDINESQVPARSRGADIVVLVDRLVYRAADDPARLTDSLETAFASGSGRATIIIQGNGSRLQFSQSFACSTCNISYEEPEPRLFSFNNPFGACPECQGFGRAIGIDLDLVVPDKNKSLRDGAIVPWTTSKFRENHTQLMKVAGQAGIRTSIAFRDLTSDELNAVLQGSGDYDGVFGFFRRIEKKAYKIYYRVLLSRYRGYTTCPSCMGGRLRPEARQVKVGGISIVDAARMIIADARAWVDGLVLSTYERDIAWRILAELSKRLKYLDDVGLGYLSLDRLSQTLSGGESQRINLATCLGSTLVGAVYVLDEPSIGLHSRDSAKLIAILKTLRDAGNTVMVVEHDEDMMRASDVIVDLGPLAGERGGAVVTVGSPAEVSSFPSSLTGEYLAGKRGIPLPKARRANPEKTITIVGAAEHNLKNITVEIPLHMLVCITGVSGSGKSTLVHSILYEGMRKVMGEFGGNVGVHGEIRGTEHVAGVELVDQSPIGRSPRSNPITYIQAFDAVRALFASTQAARIHGFTPGHFSFNVPGGRCETCEGDGLVTVEMQFLADLSLVCDACKGTRYKKEILDITHRGKNIDEVLRMTVSEALSFFGAHPEGTKVANKLKVLDDVGLGYVRLGQSSTTLSGGEAQRIKLAAHLSRGNTAERILFLFDEPTTGLHVHDIAKLLRCFDVLLAAGHSVVIIEHNLEVIKCADHVIDLGPDAGDQGGYVVAVGTPEHIASVSGSITGKHLRRLLSPRPP